MSYASRRALVPITLVFALALFVSACSPGSQEARAVGDSEIGLDMTSGGFTITVENRAGHQLIQVEVAINVNPSAPPLLRGPYIAKVSRLATGGKRVLSLGEFATPRGARVNLNVVRPREVVVTASDIDGKKYEASLPWKP